MLERAHSLIQPTRPPLITNPLTLTHPACVDVPSTRKLPNTASSGPPIVTPPSPAGLILSTWSAPVMVVCGPSMVIPPSPAGSILSVSMPLLNVERLTIGRGRVDGC